MLDSERRLVAASPAAAEALGDVTPGRRLGEDAEGAEPGPLVLFLDALPELSAYQELGAGFAAAVSHELRTPLARMLVLFETRRFRTPTSTSLSTRRAWRCSTPGS